MFFLMCVSALSVGFLHSLIPNHWLPVALLVRAKKWSWGKGLLAASGSALGHIFFSAGLAGICGLLEIPFLGDYEEEIEKFQGLLLLCFGVLYGILGYTRHVGCQGDHSHHGLDPQRQSGWLRGTWVFLFSVGLFPCFAALPLFMTAAAHGRQALEGTVIGFSLGVWLSFLISSLIARKGLKILDRPLLEHYGEVLTGVLIALTGLWLMVF